MSRKKKEESNKEEKAIDFTQMFDLNRTTLVTDLVKRMEECMRMIKDAQADLKQLLEDCHTEHEFSPKDIAAMKKLAKLRLDDKAEEARIQLAALRRIGKAIDLDLFNWQDAET